MSEARDDAVGPVCLARPTNFVERSHCAAFRSFEMNLPHHWAEGILDRNYQTTLYSNHVGELTAFLVFMIKPTILLDIMIDARPDRNGR